MELLENYDTDFFIPIHLLSFCLFVEAAKKLRTKKKQNKKPQQNNKKKRDTFKLNFCFRVLQSFSSVECFPGPVEITCLPVKALEESRTSFLANYESSASGKRGLRVILANCES